MDNEKINELSPIIKGAQNYIGSHIIDISQEPIKDDEGTTDE